MYVISYHSDSELEEKHIYCLIRYMLQCTLSDSLRRIFLDLRNLSTPGGILAVLEYILLMLNKLVLPVTAKFVRLDTDAVVRLRSGDALHSDICKRKSRHFVEP
jgi:hypothetical protein